MYTLCYRHEAVYLCPQSTFLYFFDDHNVLISMKMCMSLNPLTLPTSVNMIAGYIYVFIMIINIFGY